MRIKLNSTILRNRAKKTIFDNIFLHKVFGVKPKILCEFCKKWYLEDEFTCDNFLTENYCSDKCFTLGENECQYFRFMQAYKNKSNSNNDLFISYAIGILKKYNFLAKDVFFPKETYEYYTLYFISRKYILDIDFKNTTFKQVIRKCIDKSIKIKLSERYSKNNNKERSIDFSINFRQLEKFIQNNLLSEENYFDEKLRIEQEKSDVKSDGFYYKLQIEEVKYLQQNHLYSLIPKKYLQ